MLKLAGYEITEKIYEDYKTIVYRGHRKQNQQAIILKTLKGERPSLKEVLRIQHEYEITKSLDLRGIVKPCELEKYNGLAIVFEDSGGQSLNHFIARDGFDLSIFLSIATQLVKTLGKLHEKNIIHKDIKPLNIIFNPKDGQVKITDFANASLLSQENQAVITSQLLEGTLAYMSPEQTGRMNRSIDYRTDFYSLGVTFYEMLTGQLPFCTEDPIELIHYHLAKQPLAPHHLKPEIPSIISDIVMKLMSKTVEHRYQSAYGIQYDLEVCLTQLQKDNQIEHFTLGQKDVSTRFQIPQRLYGRDRELRVLMDACDRISSGNAEMILVKGYSGVGKSTLVREIYKPLSTLRYSDGTMRQIGYFAVGKFDQFKRNIPYACLIEAFQELMRQILTESEAQIKIWKEKILTAIGSNGQIIINVIPEVQLIIGQQPALPCLAPTETQNRFKLVFQQFLSVFTTEGHSLVLFLDDLQWADSASLNLIQLMMAPSAQTSLLVIGAYRDNEVSVSHPLVLALDAIRQLGTEITTLSLMPLGLTDVTQLLADTLHRNPLECQPFSELLLAKTNGNPFFLAQMLTALYQERHLSFDAQTGCWRWNLAQLQEVGITDNVAELMVSKIQKLSKPTQTVLKLAACIGSRFDLGFLSIVNQKPLSTTAGELWEALQEGLILPTSEIYKFAQEQSILQGDPQTTTQNESLKITYKFLHDRVQQAAYSLISDDQKQPTHLKIGRLLLRHTPAVAREEVIFELVNHFNIGADLIVYQAERYAVAELNLVTGRKAKAATAYEVAVRYLSAGLKLLPEESWQLNYDLTLSLHLEALEAEYLNTRFERAEELADIVLHHAQELLEKVKVYEIKIQFHISQNQQLAAIETSLEILNLLGEPLVQEEPQNIVVEDLILLPKMTNLYKLAAMRILMLLVAPAMYARPALLPSIAHTMITLSVNFGNSEVSAYGYAFYGLILCSSGKKIKLGYQFGQLAMQVLEQFNAKELYSKVVNIFNVFIRHWKEPVCNTIKPLHEGIQVGFETGDIEYACYNAISYCTYRFFSGETLETVQQQQHIHIDLLIKLKQEYSTYFLKIGNQLVSNLMNQAPDKFRLIGEDFNEEEVIPTLIESNNFTLLFFVYLAKTILLYFLQDYQQAIVYAKLAEKHTDSMVGFMHVPELNFYTSLTLLALCTTATADQKAQYLEQVQHNQVQMQEWATHAPANYQHKFDLVEAERARISGQILEAMEWYDRAIQGAKTERYLQETALAYERAAEFYKGCGRVEIAQFYIAEAYYAYGSWGASAKVEDLEAKHPQLKQISPNIQIKAGERLSTTTSIVSNRLVSLDLATIVKASQAIAGEIVLSRLLNTLLKIVMENAGAQSSCLILQRNGGLVVEATASIDQEKVNLHPSLPIEASQSLPLSLLYYVARTQENLVLADAMCEGKFISDPYLSSHRPKSVLCAPIVNGGKLIGLLYLENNLTVGAFSPDRLEMLTILSAQAAISIENALLYDNLATATDSLKQANIQLEDFSRTLQQKVAERTLELREKNQKLNEQKTQTELALHELKKTQTQLVQSEKMSSLGQLVAGIAHEINNPINFVSGNIAHVTEYMQEVLSLLQVYQQHYSPPVAAVQARLEEIDLDFLLLDFPKTLASMYVGAERIRGIVQSLRNFSRLGESQSKEVDIHEGIDSTLLILENRLKEKSSRPRIQIIKKYRPLPKIDCYAGQLNQVFMNLISNAIDALDDYDRGRSSAEIQDQPSTIRISTEVCDRGSVRICIRDNGAGMSKDVQHQLFDPFFTTKPVGSGTGLGLSISYHIVVDQHGGQLTCVSEPGQGAEFVIELPISQASRRC
ncbi:trifunctional serine/threonine-protein kinase/ATP-binding protein/sensor histidine kinase [Phormidesmis sp. 146-33]